MKMDRLLGILTILLRRESVTAPELARRFEVSRRTINRDVEALCKAGVPLVTRQGYGGGIAIADGYTLDRSLFTPEEWQTLLTGFQGLGSVSSPASSASLLEKLLYASRQTASQAPIQIDLASHYQKPLTEKIERLRQAVLQRRLATFQYYYAKGACMRTVEPYRLLFQWSAWYLFGYCLAKQAFRLFKLNRLWDLTVLDETFPARPIPADALCFDRYFTNGAVRLTAEFCASEQYRLMEEYGADAFRVCDNGRLRFTWMFASYEEMRRWILSFGDRVRVLEPEALRLDIRRQAGNILRQAQET